MSLWGAIVINDTALGHWSARRVVTSSPNRYECEVQYKGHRLTFELEHHYEDGALALAAAVIEHAKKELGK